MARVLAIVLLLGLSPFAIAQKGSPTEECCEDPSLTGPTTGGRGNGEPRQFATLNGEWRQEWGLPEFDRGVTGYAVFYSNKLFTQRVGDLNGPLGKYLHEKNSVPRPGGTLIAARHKTPGTPCDLPARFNSCVVLPTPPHGATTCICEVHNLGGPPSIAASVPAMLPSSVQGTAGVFSYASDSSSAQLRWYNPDAPSGGTMEVMHADGTIACYKPAVDGAITPYSTDGEVLRMELAWVRDPFDNQIDYVYDAQSGEQIEVRYPTGLIEAWNWNPAWAGGGTGPWSNYSGIEVTYRHESGGTTTHYPEMTWGMVFSGPYHFGSPLYRMYMPRTSYVETPASGAIHDLSTDVPAAFTVFENTWVGGNLIDVDQFRDSASSIAPEVASNLSTVETISSFSYDTNDRVSAHAAPQHGAGWSYTYDLPSPHPSAGASTQALDPDGNITVYQFDSQTERVYERTVEAGTGAVNRPRFAEWQGQQNAPPVEPDKIVTTYEYGPACVCQKATKITTTPYVGGQAVASREVSFVWNPVTKLLTSRTEQDPSNPGQTVTFSYLYDSVVVSPTNEWSQTRIAAEISPDGTTTYSYEWEPRSDPTSGASTLPRHGYKPSRITKVHVAVRRETNLQTDGSSTSVVADVQVVTDLRILMGTLGAGDLQGVVTKITADGEDTGFAYDGNGQLSTITSPAGVVTAFVHDPRGRLTGVTRNAGSTQSSTTSYGLGATGRPETTTVSGVQGLNLTSSYRYDRWGNLAVELKSNDPSTGRPGYTGARDVRRDWVYNYDRPAASYSDRRPLDAGSGGTLADAPGAWMARTFYYWTGNGRVASIRKPNGAVATYKVDGYGTLYGVTHEDPSGGAGVQGPRTFVNGFLEPVEILEGDTLTTRIERNAAGYVTKVWEPSFTLAGYSGATGGARHEMTLDSMGRVVSQLSYDNSSGALLAHVDFGFDQLHRTNKVTTHVVGGGASGTHVAIRQYRSNSLELVDQEQQTGGYERNYTYQNTRLLSVGDGENLVTYVYKSGTNWVSEKRSRLFDQPTAGNVTYKTLFAHDKLGRVLTASDIGTGLAAHTHTFAYNSLGNVDRYIGPMGYEQLYDLDAAGRVVKHRRLGDSGTATDDIETSSAFEDWLAVGESRTVRTDDRGNTTQTYLDFAGRIQVLMNPGATVRPTAASPHRPFAWFAEYDSASRVSKVYDGDQGVTDFFRDGVGRLIRREAPLAYTLPQISSWNMKDEIVRDAMGRVLETVGYRQAGSAATVKNVTETFSPDSLGRVHKEEFQFNIFAASETLRVESAFPGADSARIGVDYHKGASLRLALDTDRDSLGRLDRITWSRSGTVEDLASYQWQGKLRRSRTTTYSAADAKIGSATWAYDGHGRLSSLTHAADGSQIQEYVYSMDAAGNLNKEEYTKLGVAPGIGDRFVHDAHHRLEISLAGVDQATMDLSDADLRSGTGGTQTFIKKMTYGLDGVHNRSTVTEATSSGSSTDTYTTEANSNRYSDVTGLGGLEYDLRGNLIFDGERYYVYDYLNRLSEVWAVQSGESSAASSGGSTAMAAASPSSPTGSAQQYALLDCTKLEQARESVLHDNGDCLQRILTGQVNSARFREGLKADIPDGGVIRIGSTGGMLFSNDAELGLIAAYLYDVFNRRVVRGIISEANNYGTAWDGWQEVMEVRADGLGGIDETKQFVWGGVFDELVAYRRYDGAQLGWTDYFMHGDGAEGASRLVGADGQIAESYQYDVHGRAEVFDENNAYIGERSVVGQPFLYKAIRSDAETGLSYMRNRYYSVGLGRFLTLDPIGVWGDPVNSGSGYAYVGGGVASTSDPMGLQSWTRGYHAFMSRGKQTTHPTKPPPPLFDLLFPEIVEFSKGPVVAAALTIGLLVVEETCGTITAVYYVTAELRAGNIVAAALEVSAAIPGVPRLKRVEEVLDVIRKGTMGPCKSVTTKKLRRPELRVGTKKKVRDNAPKDKDGNFIDPNDDAPIEGPFHYGHKPGYENRRLLKKAEEEGLTQAELRDLVNNHPEWFQIERPSNNMSGKFEMPGNTTEHLPSFFDIIEGGD